MSNRVHRIGQTKLVRIYHIHVRFTIEDALEAIRKQKEKVTNMVDAKRTTKITDKNSIPDLVRRVKMVFQLS